MITQKAKTKTGRSARLAKMVKRVPYPRLKVSMPQGLMSFWGNYADFKSQSSRSEYWWATLWNAIFYAIIFAFFGFSTYVLGVSIGIGAILWIMSVLGFYAYFAMTLMPNLALQVRRYRDVGLKLPWSILILILENLIYVVLFVPMITSIKFGHSLSITMTVISLITIVVSAVIASLPRRKLEKKS